MPIWQKIKQRWLHLSYWQKQFCFFTLIASIYVCTNQEYASAISFVLIGAFIGGFLPSEKLVSEQWVENIHSCIQVTPDAIIVNEHKLSGKQISQVVLDKINKQNLTHYDIGQLAWLTDQNQVGLVHFPYTKGGQLKFFFPVEQVDDLRLLITQQLSYVTLIK
ncbi:hypothetical protein C2869_11295 [Saccharobesus litoralis]|uniref:Uncharacterized protein n=1 Tax=Saccharobesus litoralis TaxID=2172099 RepID=A0A2S0VRZ4_9ALTE|nr:hypothetical protein [Saccharobesus litoralis]AWB66986.1 hypothetical protein C2869_11295 [Saccharobesus litoralis]